MDFTIITALFEQKTTMEFMRLGIVYAHLIACCVAIGMVLTSDFAMIKELFKGGNSHLQDSQHMESLQKSVSAALAVLWVSGVAIIWLDISASGLSYLLNPKLQAKITIVMLLTFNGMLLHGLVLPALQKAGSLLKLNFSMRMFALFAGALSGVSWFYAAMLGIGRPLSWKYSLTEILAAYPVMIVGGFAAMVLLTQWAMKREAREEQGDLALAPVIRNPALAAG
ncbi:hypothetical protein LPB260_24245 [Pseudomonas sp. LPB0260]|uniref:hypothetical protein n=1 Tax=Pseudomonas sp. LPB0260 TaxID=2614442 RepID=UPI0015C28341|nr:hypothetical protein [Pseudomonas sp. LPB0260]QLC73824.1 hypothetical protein LPB260_09295 [Pseudomonas sp. LPB0260]QLC76598.1 hypothetical protein LPB260_24245 [Pseudomonas sp. LPB0260]